MAGTRSSTSDLLRVIREDPNVLIVDPKKDFRTFRVEAASPMGTKRGTGRGGFLDSDLAAIEGFYGAVVQQLRPWSAKVPPLPTGGHRSEEHTSELQSLMSH